MLLSDLIRKKKLIIKTGLTFSGGINYSDQGNCYLIQSKDLLKEGDKKRLDLSELDQIDLKISARSWFVQAGDVVILKKGGDWQAHLAGDVPEQTVIGQTFLLIRITGNKDITPEFLSFYLNLPSTQMQLSAKSGGGKQASISKKDLEEIQIPDLTDGEQQQLMELAETIEDEKQLLLSLIDNRQQQLQKAIEMKLEASNEKN